jgi:hypothetical protein
MTTTPPPPPPPPPQPTPPSRPRLLKGLTCASCGGTIDVEEGLTTLSCQYCGTPQAVVGERGVQRVMVLDEIDRSGAETSVRRWFARGVRKEPALKREARFDEGFLAWFPFVRARCDVVGWVLGLERKRKKRGNRWVTVEIPVEHQVERPVDRTQAAADMAEFGVGRVDLQGDVIVPLDEDTLRKRGMVFRPNRAPAEIAADLMKGAVDEAERASRPDRTTFSWISVTRRRTTLVYYPLWVFRYGFRQRTYQVLVDAEDGSLAYGKAPGNHLWRAFTVVAACAGASFVGTSILQHAGLLLRSENGLLGLGVVGLILAGFVHWGYRQFRRGGVVEEGSGRLTGDDSVLKTISRMTDTLDMD